MNVLVPIVGLLLLILVHELGHFLAAKSVHMKATRFSLGFPPALVKRKFGETEYAIGAIPLGGYVRIVGMARPRSRDLRALPDAVEKAASQRAEDVPDRLTPAYARAVAALDGGGPQDMVDALDRLSAALEDDIALVDPERVEWCRTELERIRNDVDPRAYWRAPVWKRVVVIAAGPLANVVAALAILVVFFAHGEPTFAVTRTVDQVGAGTAAAKMGLRHGDVVLRVNGRAVANTNAVRTQIQRGGPVTLLVRRGAGPVRLPHAGAAPARPTVGCDGHRYLGFSFAERRSGTLDRGLVGSVNQASSDLWYTTRATFGALGSIDQGCNQLTTPVGIVQQSEGSVSQGVYPRLLALISLSLAIFNLLPFLPLDGGHILFALIEKIRRRPVRREVYERVSAIGIAVMLMLFVVGLTHDVSHLSSGPKVTP